MQEHRKSVSFVLIIIWVFLKGLNVVPGADRDHIDSSVEELGFNAWTLTCLGVQMQTH